MVTTVFFTPFSSVVVVYTCPFSLFSVSVTSTPVIVSSSVSYIPFPNLSFPGPPFLSSSSLSKNTVPCICLAGLIVNLNAGALSLSSSLYCLFSSFSFKLKFPGFESLSIPP